LLAERLWRWFCFNEWRGTLWSGEGAATERGMRGRWRGWERAGWCSGLGKREVRAAVDLWRPVCRGALGVEDLGDWFALQRQGGKGGSFKRKVRCPTRST